MTTKSDLKNMLLQFRVLELQNFLHEFGCRPKHNMRKKELQKKAIQVMTAKRASTVASTIISLHQEMIANREENAAHREQLADDRALGLGKRRYSLRDKLEYDDPRYAPEGFSKARYPEYNNKQSNPLDLSQTSAYLESFQNVDAERVKRVKFPKLPFFEHVSDIMLVTPLIPRSENDALFEFRSTFSLSAEAVRCLFNCDDQNAEYAAMLRMCSLNDRFQVEDALPMKLYVSVNDRFCPCVPDTYNSRYESAGKRPGTPMNITPYVDKTRSTHKLAVHWSVSYSVMYAVTVQLVKKRAADELISRLIDKGEQDPSVSEKLIRENLNDEDSDIAATSLKMSLVCPLGKIPMTLPARGTTCNHLQCFDGRLFIRMNEIKSTWQCPVCSLACPYEHLYVDGYFMNILRSDRLTPDVRDVQLNADGSWESATCDEAAPKRKRASSSPTPVDVCEKRAKRRADEKGDEASPELSDSGQGSSIADDLREIFNSLIDGMSDSRSQYSRQFSGCGSVAEDDGAATNSTATSQTRSQPTDGGAGDSGASESSSAEKEVLLVDLTLSSDSESDDVKSTSSSSSSSLSDNGRVRESSPECARSDNDCLVLPTTRDLPARDLPARSSPPVYNIDSDDSRG